MHPVSIVPTGTPSTCAALVPTLKCWATFSRPYETRNDCSFGRRTTDLGDATRLLATTSMTPESLSPNVSRIVFDVMFLLQECQELLLKGHLAMMLLLPLNVAHGHVFLRNPNAECAITFLPGKSALIWKR